MSVLAAAAAVAVTGDKDDVVDVGPPPQFAAQTAVVGRANSFPVESSSTLSTTHTYIHDIHVVFIFQADEVVA